MDKPGNKPVPKRDAKGVLLQFSSASSLYLYAHFHYIISHADTIDFLIFCFYLT